LIRYLQSAVEQQHWRYLEVRPISGHFGEANHKSSFSPAAKYYLHTLSLCPAVDDLFQGFDKDCVQRRIRRGDRAGLIAKCGRSEEMLKDFYTLFVATRSRHCLPPMPYAWFQNLSRYLGESVEIRIAYKSEVPVSAVLTLLFKDTVLYKYGCSDARFKSLGATPWLLWKAIAAAKSKGALRFDFGRTEEDNKGLLEFKNRWVPKPQELIYWKIPKTSSIDSARGWKLQMAKRAFSVMPKSLLRLTGRLLYRHVG
jgi:lipid II:glycine glycyltransferase (peptidoglycan interpeptide bridge formation enzyme)